MEAGPEGDAKTPDRGAVLPPRANHNTRANWRSYTAIAGAIYPAGDRARVHAGRRHREFDRDAELNDVKIKLSDARGQKISCVTVCVTGRIV